MRKKYFAIFLAIITTMAMLTSCGFSVGKTTDLGSGTSSTDAYTTNSAHETTGSAEKHGSKGSASFDIKDGIVTLSTLSFGIPSGCTVESPSGVVDGKEHLFNHVVVYSGSSKVADIYDGILPAIWPSDANEAAQVIKEVAREIGYTLNFDPQSISQGNLYTTYANADSFFLQFFGRQGTGDFACLVTPTPSPDADIANFLYNTITGAYQGDPAGGVSEPVAEEPQYDDSTGYARSDTYESSDSNPPANTSAPHLTNDVLARIESETGQAVVSVNEYSGVRVSDPDAEYAVITLDNGDSYVFEYVPKNGLLWVYDAETSDTLFSVVE